MITLMLLSFTSAYAADTGARLDPSLVETELVRQGIELQALEAELAALRAQCAKVACAPVVVTPAPATAPKPKAAPKPAAKPEPVPAAAPVTAPVAAPVTAPVVVPNAEIAALREEIRVLREQIARLPTSASVVNNHPVVERTEVIRSAGTRFHLGITEMAVGSPPLPGSATSVVDRTEVLVRYEWAVGKQWVGLEVSGGYGFVADSTSIRALPTFTANLGPGTDLNLGAGVSYLCESAFTGGPLCSAARTGGQAQVGIAQQAGPVALEAFIGGGYDMVDSSSAGIGGVGYGYGGVRVFVGTVGKVTTVTVR